MKCKNSLVSRAVCLFATGAFLSLVLNMLQIQHHLPSFKHKLVLKLLYSSWWVPTICGIGSAIVGLLYPCFDSKLGEQLLESPEWSKVMRCITLFVGINHATTKINFSSNLELSISLAVLSIGLWWVFDRTRSGFGMGIGIAILATLMIQMLVQHEFCKFTEREFLYIRSWLPSIVFSGGVTIGNIGRKLALIEEENGSKKHQE
ncbi:insulin-induced gene 2 protein-like [Centruroides vittatus]|uniref:insulin-induced gene 2 protein-like n=1 Tax=Centruroides vittatus TaxID=120091 RepID=UPI00350F5632